MISLVIQHTRRQEQWIIIEETNIKKEIEIEGGNPLVN